MSQLSQWIDANAHLPRWLRDFHDQKDVFKTIGGIEPSEGSVTPSISWVDGHIYTIDRFLSAMARFGFTLQRSRARMPFSSLEDAITARRELELHQLRTIMQADEGDGA